MADRGRVAVLGTGTMGSGMAHSLSRAGFDVAVWNRTRSRAEAIGGVRVADTPADAARGAQVVITTLPHANAVAEVIGKAADGMTPNTIWVQSSTVGREGIARLADLAGKRGFTLVDAPVVGTKGPAEAGRLVVLAAGPSHTHAPLEAVFAAIGGRTMWLGDEPGPASAMKLVANSWIATITAGAAQVVELATGLGLDPRQALDLFTGTQPDSAYLQLKGKAMIDGDFTPQFELDGMVKDLGLIHSAADDARVSSALITALLAIYGEASDSGHGHDDIAAVVEGLTPGASVRR